MTFSTPKLENAITQFRSHFPGHEQMFRHGQFYVHNRMISELIGQIETALRNNVRLQFALPGHVDGAIRFFTAKLSESPIPVSQILQMLDTLDVGGDLAPIRAMLGSAPQDAADMQNAFSTVWSSDTIPSGPLHLGAATLGKAQAAFDLEKTKCYEVLRALARKLLKSRSISSLPAAAKVSEGATGNAFIQGAAPGAETEVPQQVVRYNAPAALNAAMERMKATLDAGGYVQCGLLSGVSHERSAFPQPEHYVMAFAYDTVNGQNAYLCWDPDAARSNIASTGWGRGLTVLFGATGRLSSAADDADLTAIDRNKTSPTFGDHQGERVRHCYQAYYLQSLPL
jgi:hypothetical protein